MPFLAFTLPSAATCFVFFFGISLLILLAILVAAAPGVCRAVGKHTRQFFARRGRGRRILADRNMLQQRANALEGVVLDFSEECGEDGVDSSEISSAA
ncbi:MAG: hypothetical protein MI807_01560 [Verrucomicrobiales bacterium]|nr:hypothetical protein [Verrucomicrobiales bacterium]